MTTLYQHQDGDQITITDSDGNVQGTFVDQSDFHRVFMRGLGVISDVELIEFSTGHVLVVALNYKPIFSDTLLNGADRARS